MIKIKKEEVSRMKLMANKVLVKPSREMDELILSENDKIFIDPAFAQEKHAPTRAIVQNVCPDLNLTSMLWNTSIELIPGDEVIYSFEAAMDCIGDDDSRIFIDEKMDKYFIIDYSDIFLAKRNGDIIPINGYVLCEPLEEEITSKIQLPDFLRKTRSDKFGKVAYLGKRNTEYYEGTGRMVVRQDLKDPYEVSVGDIIIFDKNCDLPVEYDLHQSIEGRKKTFYRMHRCYIKAIIQKSHLHEFGIA